MGPMRVMFSEPNRFGVLDHAVIPDSGAPMHNPMRALANGSGSEVVFTLFRRPEMSDDDFARDADALETLIREVRADARALEAELAVALDDSGDFAAAASLVRKLRFLEKLEADLGEALEALLF